MPRVCRTNRGRFTSCRRQTARSVRASSGKARFDTLRAQYRAAYGAARNEAITQSIKYGSEREARSWASRGEKNRLEKLEKKRDRIGDAIIDLIVRESPRGEAWKTGVPTFWLRADLPWEDVVRPADEPLSRVPPPSFGWSEAEVRRHLGT
jgi:hypothetical protein